MNLHTPVARWADWFNGRAMRERIYMGVCVGVVLLFLGWQLLLAPLLRSSGTHLKQIQAQQSQQARLERQITQLQGALRHNPNERLQQRKQQLLRHRRVLDTQLHQDIQALVSPARMLSLLRQMLVSRQSLQLDSVRHLKPRLLKLSDQGEASKATEGSGKKAAQAAANNGDQPRLYAHDVELVVSGSYFQLLDYLKALEGLHQQFGWRLLDYQVQHYPKAKMRLKLETLSLDKEWIGA